MRIIYLALLFLFSQQVFAVGQSESSAYLEVAPLKGAYGQISARGEIPVWRAMSLGMEGESISHSGDREDFSDSENIFGLEAVFYPWQNSYGKLFVGAGLRFTETETGRKRQRDTQTWVRVRSDEMTETWVDHGNYLSSIQTIGYRTDFTQWLTASIRLVSEQIMQKSVKSKADKVYEGSDPLDQRTRSATPLQVSMLFGIALP
jgi:hypothetical protein